jgi:hypothetical protein
MPVAQAMTSDMDMGNRSNLGNAGGKHHQIRSIMLHFVKLMSATYS